MAMINNKEINLYARLIDNPEKKSKNHRLVLCIFVALVTIGALTGISLTKYAELKGLEDDCEQMQIKIEDTVIIDRIEQAGKYKSLTSTALTRLKAFEKVSEDVELSLSQASLLTEDLVSKIESCQNNAVRLTEISYASGVVSISGMGQNALDAASFVTRLEATDKFIHISYYGFALNADDGYVFTVQAIL